jgi:hypothetical protein
MITETRFKISVPRFKRSPVDTSQYKQMLNFSSLQDRPIVRDIITDIRFIVKEETGHDPFICGTSRKKEFVASRQFFVYFSRKYSYLTFSEIGSFLGRDHATVMYALKCVNKFRSFEKPYRDKFNAISKKVKYAVKNSGY